MKRSALFLILLIISVLSNNDATYEKLINEEVSEEYCTSVISNITKLLEEGYVYLEFYKSPIKPKGSESYDIEALDLIKELEAIPKTNRKFYDFYRDIYKIIKKTGDHHLSFNVQFSPINKINLDDYYYDIPFIFQVVDEFDDDGNVNDTYLTIAEDNNGFTPPSIQSATDSSDYEDYLDKKIVSINDTEPFEFIVNLLGPFSVGHNSQINYVATLESIQSLNIKEFPFFKEELSNIKLEFEDGEEFTFNFTLNSIVGDSEFREYYQKKLKRQIPFYSPFINIREIYKQYKQKTDPNYKTKRKIDEIDWDYVSEDELIKCRVDEDNKKNVMFQQSFAPDDINEYYEIMLKCLDSFYTNNYEIIVIESKNNGGYGPLCFPMTQYLRPKIRGFCSSSSKNTEVNYDNNIGNLEYETCDPIDSYEKLNPGIIDDYGNGVIHNRTKGMIFFDIYSEKELENNRRKYIESKNTKKPTEIIIFTDGFTFSCGSILIKNMQVYGSAIVVGYRAHKNINDKKDFDASQFMDFLIPYTLKI